jgi:uncharacterized membrane protein
VSLYEWLLFLHVLAAFTLIAAIVLYTYLIVASLSVDRPGDVVRTFRMATLGDVLSGVGSLGTLAFGIWLALEVDGYKLWDGWIIAAFVLWATSGGFVDRGARHYRRVRARAKALLGEGRDEPSSELSALLTSPRVLVLHSLGVVLTLLLLLDMIWKPGA